MNDDKKKLNAETLINCMDVLCRANATVFETDPKLAADIAQAIEALSDSLNAEDSVEETTQDAGSVQQAPQSQPQPQPQPFVLEEENGILDVLSIKTPKEATETISQIMNNNSDEIVDVLTNEVIKKNK